MGEKMSKSINDLHPYVKHLAERFLEECNKQNFPVMIYHTFRTIKEQNDLYALGRTKAGNIVTNARGGYSYHNYGLAFDAAPLIEGKIDWKRNDLFEKMGQIGKSVGLEWGGEWRTFKDTPHLQWSGGLAIKDLLAGKKPVAPEIPKPIQSKPTPAPAPAPKPTPAVPSSNVKVDYMRLLKLSSIKKFQTIMGLKADGILGMNTQKVINTVLKMPPCKIGSSGSAVRYIQYRVGATIDGKYGPKTAAQVNKFKKKNNLSQDGKVDAKTWKVLI